MTLTFRPTIKETAKPLSLRVTLWGAVVYAAWTALATIGTIIALFGEGAVSVAVPVAQFWPKLYPTAHITDGPTAHVRGGGFDLAHLQATGLGINSKLWFAAGDLLQGATFVIIALAVALLCSRLMKENPFEVGLTATFRLTGGAIIVGGLGWQLCYGIAGTIAAVQLLRVTSWSVKDIGGHPDNLSDIGWPSPGNGLAVDFWPIWVGLALFAVAACLRFGEQLQRERASLERERRRLQRETEGLV